MKISNHVYSNKMEFTANTPFGLLKRHAFVFLLVGSERTCLVDAGTKPLLPDILSFIQDSGKAPIQVDEILITHNHSDHTGALKSLKDLCSCPVAASEKAVAWIENIDLQFQLRPVPRFYEFVEGNVKVDHILNPGDIVSLGDCRVEVYAAPGHSPDQLAYFLKEDGVLLSADAVPVPGDMPVYCDVAAQLETLQRLKSIPGKKILLMSWADPVAGEDAVNQALDDAQAYVSRIHALTRTAVNHLGNNDPEAVAKAVHEELGLAPGEFTRMFIQTITAHMALLNSGCRIDT